MLTLFFFALLGYGVYNGVLAALGFWAAALGLLMVPVGIYLDVRWFRRRRRVHPDQNWHNLPRFNALGFNRHGAWILPDTDEARQLERWKRGHGSRP